MRKKNRSNVFSNEKRLRIGFAYLESKKERIEFFSFFDLSSTCHTQTRLHSNSPQKNVAKRSVLKNKILNKIEIKSNFILAAYSINTLLKYVFCLVNLYIFFFNALLALLTFHPVDVWIDLTIYTLLIMSPHWTMALCLPNQTLLQLLNTT